jgi:uncharacterized cupredoxin-like copper-binding protein
MSSRRLIKAGGGLAATALAVAACGSQGQQPSGGAQGPPASSSKTASAPTMTITMRETDFRLDPANPTIKKAGTVRFNVENRGQSPHALEVEGPKGEAKTGQLSPGASTTLTVDLSKPGTYEMYCPVDDHKGMGMKGKITVQ